MGPHARRLVFATLALAFSLVLPAIASAALPVGPEFPIYVGQGGAMNPDSDGATVVFNRYSDNEVWAYDVATAGLQKVRDGGDFYPCWFPRVSGDVVVWQDARHGDTDWDIYGYRFSTGEEIPICTSPNASSVAQQQRPDVSGDLVVWIDFRTADGHGDIWGKYLSGGNEFPIIQDVDAQEEVLVSGDTLVWTEYSWSGGEYSIRGYDVSTATEFTVCAASGKQWHPSIDGSLVVWEDQRVSEFDSNIYGYDLSIGEEFNVCTRAGQQAGPEVAGNVVVWGDGGAAVPGIYGRDLATGVDFLVKGAAGSPSLGGDVATWVIEGSACDLYGARIAFWEMSVVIDGGALATKDRDVTAAISASRCQRTVTEMRFSTNGSDWTGWETYAATKDVVLPDADGTHSVFVQFRDDSGEVSPTASDDIALDTVAPTTESNADGLWHNADVTVTLTAEDVGAGVASTYYRVDGGATKEGTSVLVPAPSDHSNDAVHVIDYWSVDVAGNTEAPTSCQVRIDTTPPTTSDDAPTAWQNESVTVNLQSSDSGSGVATTRYSLDYGLWLEGNSVLVLVEGDHVLQYRSTDNAGNLEGLQSAEVKIDWTAPQGTFVLNGDAAQASSLTVSGDSAVTDANDVVDMRFSVDGKTTWTEWISYAASSSLTLPAGDGTKTVYAQYRDPAGNVLELSDSIEFQAVTSALQLDAAATIVPYNGTTTLTVHLTDAIGTALPGYLVKVQKSLDGITWTTFATVESDGGTTTTPALTRAYKFRATWAGADEYAPSESAVVTVKPKVYLGAPVAPLTIKEDVAFVVYGTLKPRHSPGWNKAVKLYCYRKNLLTGVWVLKKTVWCKTIDYSTYSRYRVSLTLPSPGTWKLRAYAPEDLRHAATWSSSVYRKVK